MAQGLDEEEGVTARDRRQCVSEFLVVVASLRDVRRDVVLVESPEGKPVGCSVAVQVGEHRRQGMRAVEVGAAICADDLHPRVIAEAQKMP
jgi:hypothetical protein